MNNFRLKKELKSRKPLKSAEMFRAGISEVKGFVSQVPKHFAAGFSKASKKLFPYLVPLL